MRLLAYLHSLRNAATLQAQLDRTREKLLTEAGLRRKAQVDLEQCRQDLAAVMFERDCLTDAVLLAAERRAS